MIDRTTRMALGGVLGGAVLVVLGAPASPASAQAPTPAGNGGACEAAVQGEIAWNYEGETRWASGNVRRLCEGAEDSREPARCFERIMHGGVDWGGGTEWSWRNALDLCQGTRDADATVTCFERRVEDLGWRQAIQTCRWDTQGGQGDGPREPRAGGEGPARQMPPVDIDWSRVAGSGGTLARMQVSPGAVAGATTPSDLRELVGLAGAISPSDYEEIEPADMDFHRASEAPPQLSWAARMNLLEQAGVRFEPVPEPPGEFVLSPREHYRRGVGHLQFKNPADLDPLSDKALMPSGARGAIEIHVRAREAGPYLLVFRVSSRQEAEYAMWVGEGDNPSYTRDAGSHNVSFVMETAEPGDVSGLFYTRDAAFTFHDVTITRVE